MIYASREVVLVYIQPFIRYTGQWTEFCQAAKFSASWTGINIVKTPTPTQPKPNITLVGLDMKMTLQTTPPSHPTHPQELNVNNISAVTDSILMTL